MEHSINNIVFYESLFLEGKFKDLLLFSDGKLLTEDGWSFDVSRFFLAQKNKYFRALFLNNGKDKNVILIPGIAGEVLNMILYYIRTESIPLSNANIAELLMASDYLLVDSLKLDIKKYLKDNISQDVCFQIYMIALQINDIELQKFVHRFIQRNFQSVVSRDLLSFKEISCDLLEEFLNDNNLCVTGEEIIWYSIKRWMMEDPDNRLSQLLPLLKCLKIGDINDSLADEIVHSEIICKNLVFEKLIHIQQAGDSPRSINVLKTLLNVSYCDFQCYRRPRYFHIIIQISEDNESANLFITYDEKVDLWQILGEISNYPVFLGVVGAKIYIWGYENNMIFDLYTKQWSHMADLGFEHPFYDPVVHGNRIYNFSDPEIQSHMHTIRMKYYDTETGMWFEAKSMQRIIDHNAVSYQNKIFVVGKYENGTKHSFMEAKFYDVDLDKWFTLPRPNIFRHDDYTFIEYHGKLYLIGGVQGKPTWNKVEVFDPVRNKWNFIADLPSFFEVPHAVVFDDQFIVYEYIKEHEGIFKPSSPISWNEQENAWEELSKASLVKDFRNYLFSKIDNNLEICEFLKEI